MTWRTLTNNYAGIKIDPAKVDGLILSQGHLDHDGALLDLVKAVPAWKDRGISPYAGGQDTFCHRWVVGRDSNRVRRRVGLASRVLAKGGPAEGIFAPTPGGEWGRAVKSP